jgi:hypothetical protein
LAGTLQNLIQPQILNFALMTDNSSSTIIFLTADSFCGHVAAIIEEEEEEQQQQQ